MAKDYIVSVDLGGTKILAALINSKNQILAKSKIPTEAGNGRLNLIKDIAHVVKEVISQKKLTQENIKAVCLGVPGSVNPYEGTIGVAPNLNIAHYNIRKELSKYLEIPILIENDVNLAALGIHKFELDGTGKNILVVFVGTGIGGAIIIDNKIYRGSNYFAGEIGHMVVQKNGPVCGCGKKGCFEAVAGRLAIVRDIKKELRKRKKGFLKKYASNSKPIKSKMLAAAIEVNDPIVTKQVAKACDEIGATLANVTNLLNLDLIVLGGGVIEALETFMIPKIKLAFKNCVLKDLGKGVKIIATKLGDDAALFGGVALAEELDEFYKTD